MTVTVKDVLSEGKNLSILNDVIQSKYIYYIYSNTFGGMYKITRTSSEKFLNKTLKQERRFKPTYFRYLFFTESLLMHRVSMSECFTFINSIHKFAIEYGNLDTVLRNKKNYKYLDVLMLILLAHYYASMSEDINENKRINTCKNILLYLGIIIQQLLSQSAAQKIEEIMIPVVNVPLLKYFKTYSHTFGYKSCNDMENGLYRYIDSHTHSTNKLSNQLLQLLAKPQGLL